MEGVVINLDTSFRKFEQLFNSRLTTERAGKLDRLDATVSSRASAGGQSAIHGQLNENKSVIDGIKATTDVVKAKTDLIARSPTSGAFVKVKSRGLPGNGQYAISVVGQGILRLVKPLGDVWKFRINVDGRWVSGIVASKDAKLNYSEQANSIQLDSPPNLAEAGIRFNAYFKIFFYKFDVFRGYQSLSVEQHILCYYTLGD